MNFNEVLSADVIDIILRITHPNRGTAFLMPYKGKAFLVSSYYSFRNYKKGKIEVQKTTDQRWTWNNPTLIESCWKKDLSIFYLEEVEDKTYCINVGKTKNLYIGQNVIWFGYPNGLVSSVKFASEKRTLMPFIKKGVFSGVNEIENGISKIIIDSYPWGNFSGSPVIFNNFKTNQKSICGVITKTPIKIDQRIDNPAPVFATPISYVTDIIDDFLNNK